VVVVVFGALVWPFASSSLFLSLHLSLRLGLPLLLRASSPAEQELATGDSRARGRQSCGLARSAHASVARLESLAGGRRSRAHAERPQLRAFNCSLAMRAALSCRPVIWPLAEPPPARCSLPACCQLPASLPLACHHWLATGSRLAGVCLQLCATVCVCVFARFGRYFSAGDLSKQAAQSGPEGRAKIIPLVCLFFRLPLLRGGGSRVGQLRAPVD